MLIALHMDMDWRFDSHHTHHYLLLTDRFTVHTAVVCVKGHCACVLRLLQWDGLHTYASCSITLVAVCPLILPVEHSTLAISSVGMSTAAVGVPAHVQRCTQVPGHAWLLPVNTHSIRQALF